MRPSAIPVYAILRRLSPEQLATVTRDDLVAATGFAPATISRSMKDLVDGGLVELTYGPTPGAGRGWRWKGLRLLDN
jgi:hypothetical protein